MSDVFIRVNPKTNVVEYTHMFPLDPIKGLGKTRTQLLSEGYFIESYPTPANIPGKRAIPYYDRSNNSVYFQYSNIPLSTEERLSLIESAFNELLMTGIIGGE